MSTKIDKIVQTYKTLAQIPALTSGLIQSNGLISTVWSQRNLEKGTTTKFLKQIFTSDLKKVAETAPVDISSEVLVSNSHSEKYRAVLRDNDGKQFLEIWQGCNNLRMVDLNALDVHGSVYTDGDFASFEWSPDETKLLYVAEQKPPKSQPFYKRISAKNTAEGNGDEEKPRGEEHVFVQDWGEQLVGKKKSIIAQYNIENDTIEIVKGVPDNVCVAQPKYAPDGAYIVGVAYDTEPRKLGLIYCSNRNSTIFSLDFNENYFSLKLSGKAVKSPIFSPDGKNIFWLQRKSDGPHACCMELVKTSTPINNNSEIKTVVEIVQTEKRISRNKTFYGLYNTNFLKRPWVGDNKLIVSTNQKYTINIYAINVETGDIDELSNEEGSLVALDVYENTIIAVQRHFLKPDKLVIAKIPQDILKTDISWHDLTTNRNVPTLDGCINKYFDIIPQGENPIAFNAIYVGPSNGDEKSIPLIVWPHGGPHSAFANYMFLECCMLLSCGFGIVLVNFRGSLGSGQKSVEFLLGKVGTADVADCIQATEEVLKEFPHLNSNNLSLVGGSHGGFLVTHLSGQFPDKFKAVVARNPVIDVATMSTISDIPDWCYVEAGHNYTQKGEIDNEIFVEMRKVSPIVHAHKVKAPTLLQIGSKDLRVPPLQGMEYYFRLKANNATSRMNVYEDNHPLGSVPNEMDNIINSVLWLLQHTTTSN